jgi:sulfoxide reductase heme-binding subunit YedZ
MDAVHKSSPPLSWLQPAVLTGSFAPFFVLLYRAATHRLGANPIATALNQLGLLALIFLVSSLACTPAKIVFGVTWPIRLRKTLGLLAFYTACLHFLTYLVLDQGFRLRALFADVTKRPFIAVGFAALVLLVPIAATSTKESVARLGFARWKRIHRLVYAVALLAVIHFVMRVKADTREPLLWGSVVALLLVTRIFDSKRPTGKRRKKPA